MRLPRKLKLTCNDRNSMSYKVYRITFTPTLVLPPQGGGDKAGKSFSQGGGDKAGKFFPFGGRD